MNTADNDDTYSEEETARRRDEAYCPNTPLPRMAKDKPKAAGEGRKSRQEARHPADRDLNIPQGGT
jgi:hypothetical protein